MTRTRPRAILGILFLGATLAIAPGVVRSTRADAAPADLPPAKLAALAKLFKPKVKPLGLKVSRGLLQNLETYQEDPEGTHLALYVEPIDGDYSSAQYVQNFTKLTRKFIPAVFDRWEGLESFDICQEPTDDTSAVPPPVTQIFVTRDSLDRVGSWRKADLAELLAASPRVRSVAAGYYVYFSRDVRSDPTFVEAATEAGWTSESSALGH